TSQGTGSMINSAFSSVKGSPNKLLLATLTPLGSNLDRSAIILVDN
ncbi:MAG: hypothetical protein RLZZ204_985, partial [Bacteroidota bacterium]